MTLWCYSVDAGNWGQQLALEATIQGIDAQLFSAPVPEMREGDYAFMRIPQWEPECSLGKQHAKELYDRGLILVPDYFTVYSYEDKLTQTKAYLSWMPKTFMLSPHDTIGEALRMGDELGYPFISKSDRGSSSVNVRLIHTPEEAANEYNAVMDGEGLSMRIGKGRTAKQKDYLIWQKFCGGNDGDLRVCVNGEFYLMLERDNAHGSPFASGSGKNRPVNNPDDFQICALNKAQEFFVEHDLRWNGIDLVYDYDECDWKILETTLGWSAKAYEDCMYFGTSYRGRDVWALFCDQLKRGVFS